MQSLVTGMRVERGFTLIEILVVVTIIGITLGFALLAFGDFGADRRAIVNAEQFSTYLKLVQHQAILANNTLGVNLDKTGYSTYRFNQNNWQLMPKKSIFHFRAFPSNMMVSLRTRTKTKLKAPALIIDSSGNMTEFVAHFGTEQKPELRILVGQYDGQIKTERPKTP